MTLYDTKISTLDGKADLLSGQQGKVDRFAIPDPAVHRTGMQHSHVPGSNDLTVEGAAIHRDRYLFLPVARDQVGHLSTRGICPSA